MNQSWNRYLPNILRNWMEGRQHLQKAIGDTGWLLFDRFLRMAVGLFTSAWVTRYLGPEQYGLLSFASAFVFIFSSVASLGLDWVVVRNIVSNPSRRDEILGTAFVLKLLGGVATLGLSIISIIILQPNEHLTHGLVGIFALGTIFNAFGAINFWFQSQVQSKYSAYVKSVSFLLISVTKVALIFFHAPLTAFAWAALAEIIVSSAGLIAAYRAKNHYLKDWRATRAMAKELMKDSWPLLLTDVAMLAYMRIDQVILGEMTGNTEVGIYAVAVLLAESWYCIPMAVTSSIFPSIVKAREESDDLFQSRLQKYYNLMAFLGYAIAIPVTLVANWAVLLLFGGAYAKAAPMLIGLIWAGLFINITIARSTFLTVMNWTRLHFVTDFLGCVLNVSLNLFLIPHYGGMGAVIASIISYWFVAHGSCFLFKPLTKTGTMLTKALLYPKVW